MENNIAIFIIAAIIVLVSIVTIAYCYVKSKRLRLMGYDFLYYYMMNCGDLAYYRKKSNHIESKYQNAHNVLLVCHGKWYVWKWTRPFLAKLIEFYEKADRLTESVSPFFSLNHYFAFSECVPFTQQAEELEKMMEQLVNAECKEYVRKNYADMDYGSFPEQRRYEHHFESALRPKHNNEFVEKELRENKGYFDTLLKYPLDPQQRESIVKLEDNCLVISSAGSGKTSTTIAKVRYLLEKRHLNPNEILVLSYNHKTAEEFRERLDISAVECKTFHRKAMDIIGTIEGRFPDVCQNTFLLTCFYKLSKTSTSFKKAVNEFVSYRSSLTKNLHEYNDSGKYYKDRMLYGIMAPYGDMDGNPVFTRSEEEKKICTWLSSHGIDFRYEQNYPFDTYSEDHRQYKPDFTIYFNRNGQRYYAILEHFGIDMNGNVPIWFGNGKRGGFIEANNKYNEEIRWKRNVHQRFHTCLLETTSAMFHDGTIYQRLEAQLRVLGIVPRELSEDEKFEKLIERNPVMEDCIMSLFTSFINLMKSNGKTFDQIMKTIQESGQPQSFCDRCHFLMYELIKPLYEEYERGLQENHQMDFTDTILRAAEHCSSGRYKPSYSYILVDEFQDISVDRFKLIKSLIKEAPQTKTYCVGDDWQSIYRFSGSDMNLFNNFEEFFGFTEKCKIETTYRFGNPLVKKSSEFILKNPTQVAKEVHPMSDDITTEISFVPFTRATNEMYLNNIKEVIDSIPADESVMLLGRYNYEVDIFPRNCVRQAPNSKRATVTYAGRTMDFMSIHASKGLEADNVLILNCSQDKGGFPSRVADDPILAYVLSKIDDYPYSEERRLFYVAITRAKKHTYILYNSNMPSFFVKEMTETEGDNTMRCPLCKEGVLRLFREGQTRIGNPYRIYNCNNTIGGCNFQWSVYKDNDAETLSEYHRQMDKFFAPIAQGSPLGQNIPGPSQPWVASNHDLIGSVAPPTTTPPAPQNNPNTADDLPF